MARCRAAAAFGIGLAALALPGTAAAHGVHGTGHESTWEFLWIGVEHMLAGWDHLLFIAGIVLLARRALLSAKLLSLFAAGHSATLLLATGVGWQVDATLVDVLILVSVAFIGARVVRGAPERWTATGLVIFGFGLVHGLGLSTRLQSLDLPDGWALVARIVAFNVGVELGQLAAVAILASAALLAVRVGRGHRAAPVMRTAGAMILVAGLAGAGALGIEGGEAEPPAPRTIAQLAANAAPGADCRQAPYAPDLSLGPTAGHPDSLFVLPGRPYRQADLQHVLAERYLVVVYAPTIAPGLRDELRRWVETGPARAVAVPGERWMMPQLITVTRESSLVCGTLDLAALDAFGKQWAGAVSAPPARP